ncbi:DUF2809 domain-containing protein [Cellulomonas sp. URHD0024]|uniref:ribosomal maturation YjgA family protein n=1 Tax=Cellulomonas sp. URHD0024 TaxID=1302620 RepID=UPI0003F5206E|nr:DUF2809 domain-containing protein [Cellulomonas sp. URHD0024]
MVAGLVVGSNPAGDALYAALVYVLVLGLAPAVPSNRAGMVAFGICAAIELLQLTGLPAEIVGAAPAARYALGTTFQAPDLLAYAVGVLLAAGVDVLVRRRASGPRRAAVGPSDPAE